ncbi:MAG: hypothetical protein M3N16_06470, partial [Actinomycetota bacterium]|nr:hypothetical protein [Actinomycetota bacterium]
MMERLDLGGVPAFWTEGPEPAMVALSFRSGMADEPPPLRGISHLVEHLSCFTFGDRDRDRDRVNGFVDLLRTVFFAQGTQDEVSAFLRDIARAIAEPRLDRLDTERRVLRTEAAGDPGDFTARQLFLRYGYAGFGASFVRELGLGWIGPHEVERWRGERFTAGNAAVWAHGPRPPEAPLELP